MTLQVRTAAFSYALPVTVENVGTGEQEQPGEDSLLVAERSDGPVRIGARVARISSTSRLRTCREAAAAAPSLACRAQQGVGVATEMPPDEGRAGVGRCGVRRRITSQACMT